jgi:RNA polymerase sigma factor (sigma-70 family)
VDGIKPSRYTGSAFFFIGRNLTAVGRVAFYMREDLFHRVRTSVSNKLRNQFPRAVDHEVEDALSSAIETYLTKAPQNVRECDNRTQAWISTVAWRNLRRERLRRQRLSEVNELDAFTESLVFETGHLTQDLRERSREIIHLHSLHDMKPREIAAMLGCSVNAVNMHLKRGYRALRQSLKRDIAVLRESYHYWITSFKVSYAMEWSLLLESTPIV